MWSCNWPKSSKGDFPLLKAIQIALRNHESLLSFLFYSETCRLLADPAVLRERATCLSSGERVLVAVALDIWSQSGKATIGEIITKLDEDNISNVLASIEYLCLKEGSKENLDLGQLNFPTR